MRFPFFWNMMLHHRVISSWCGDNIMVSPSRVKISQKKIISKENGNPSTHTFLKFISLAGYMLNWLHSGGVSHDRTTPWHNTIHSLSHNMYYGINGGSKHRPSHWSIHEYSGTSYSLKHILNSIFILSIWHIII